MVFPGNSLVHNCGGGAGFPDACNLQSGKEDLEYVRCGYNLRQIRNKDELH